MTVNRNRKFVDLVRKVSGKWTNWDPPIPVTVGAYGTLDENGEFNTDGNIYSDKFQEYLDTHGFSLVMEDYRPKLTEPDQDYIVASSGVIRTEFDVEQHVNVLAFASAPIKGTWKFRDGKHGALIILIAPRSCFIPNAITTKILNVELLRDKYLVTSALTCPAYLMYLSSKSGESFSAAFLANTQGDLVNSKIGGEWWTENEAELLRRGSRSDGEYRFTPLFTLKQAKKRSWLTWIREERQDAGTKNSLRQGVYPDREASTAEPDGSQPSGTHFSRSSPSADLVGAVGPAGNTQAKAEMGSMVESAGPRHLDGAEEDKSDDTDNEVQEGTILARLEPEDEPSVKKHSNNETHTAIDANQSNLPCDLTGQVTKSSTHPFASGGFGDIYKGKLNVGGRSIDVAIKTTRMYLQHDQHLPKKTKQFRREVRVWSKLSHPNVLPLLGIISDASSHPDIPAMVCPWIENGALSTYLETNDLTLANRFVLINDVAHGLQYLHSLNVVHGDLSGSNVLVAGDRRACIADFGLSTLLTQLSGSTFATTHQAKGTMRWMAPELLDSDDPQVTPNMQSDVYSFGSIMLQILTGKVPYHYLPRDGQVMFAMAKGKTPRQPDEEVVTDHRWKFIERCWSPADATKPRPSGDEVLEFTGQELATIMATANSGGATIR